MTGNSHPKQHRTRHQRRAARAEQTRKRALSPMRIVMLLASFPLLAGSVALSVYLRTSPFSGEIALRHLVARAGCDAARSVGLAPARRGGPGYHPGNDRDDDGVACESWPGAALATAPAATASAPAKAAPQRGGATRVVGGAKFVRP